MLKKFTPLHAIVWTLMLFCTLSNTAWAEGLPVQQDAHGIDYVTGGIGAEEVESITAMKPNFNLYILFSEGKVGRVIDDVDVTILDAQQRTVFSLQHAAPRLLLNLPSGRYQVVAQYQGSVQRAYFSHDAKRHQRIILNWKNKIDEDTPEPESD